MCVPRGEGGGRAIRQGRKRGRRREKRKREIRRKGRRKKGRKRRNKRRRKADKKEKGKGKGEEESEREDWWRAERGNRRRWTVWGSRVRALHQETQATWTLYS